MPLVKPRVNPPVHTKGSEVFRRRQRDKDEPLLDAESVPPATETGDDVAVDLVPTEGPWDSEQAPPDSVQRLDLGSLLVPMPSTVEVRVDVDEQGQIVAATVVVESSSLQLSTFAAPRTAGIWGDVRAEIAQALQASGGSAEEVDGPFGPELSAEVPAPLPGQQTGAPEVMLAPARFLGIDGPRWFLRGLVTGPAAREARAALPLEALLRAVIVRRGNEAMAPRDALPLRLPRELTEVAESLQQQQASSGDFKPFERGPEITETR